MNVFSASLKIFPVYFTALRLLSKKLGMQQIQNNTRENALHGTLPDRIDDAIFRNMDSSTKLSTRFIGDPSLRSSLAELIYDLLTHERVTPEVARSVRA